MLTKREIRAALQRVEHLEAPVLSAYVNAIPSGPGPDRELTTRLKSTLDGLGVARDFADRILDEVANRRPRAPLLALFARPDPFEMESLELALDVGVEDPATGRGAARWGRPYAAPLIASLDDNEHCAALYLDRDRWRLFYATVASTEEVDSGYRRSSPLERDELEPSKRVHPGYIVGRGTSARDDADAHLHALRRRFFREVATRVAQFLAQRELGRLILMGPEADVAAFEETLVSESSARVEMRLPGLSSSEAPVSEVKARLSPAIAKLREERELALIDDIAKRGLTGIESCIPAWQNGQLRTVVLPWHREGRIAEPTSHLFRDPGSGYITVSEAEAQAYASDGKAEKLAYEDALAGLITTYDVELDLVRNDGAERLMELGGIGGLRRF